MWLDPGMYMIARFMSFYKPGVTLTYGKDWEQSLPYAEFSYNNSYQASLGMSPFEALYEWKCRTPLMWSEVGECTLTGPALIKEVEDRVAEIREKLKAAQSR